MNTVDRRRFLTIKGRTMTVKEWSNQPGAVRYWTILNRLNTGWAASRAVFFPVDVKRSIGGRKGARFGQRGFALAPARPPVNLRPNPHLPNPLRPCLGSVRSYPLEVLESLRRVA